MSMKIFLMERPDGDVDWEEDRAAVVMAKTQEEAESFLEKTNSHFKKFHYATKEIDLDATECQIILVANTGS